MCAVPIHDKALVSSCYLAEEWGNPLFLLWSYPAPIVVSISQMPAFPLHSRKTFEFRGVTTGQALPLHAVEYQRHSRFHFMLWNTSAIVASALLLFGLLFLHIQLSMINPSFRRAVFYSLKTLKTTS
ncbi:MAG: hypothetical protein ACYCX2_08550 [Christensenellales bacterium]